MKEWPRKVEVGIEGVRKIVRKLETRKRKKK